MFPHQGPHITQLHANWFQTSSSVSKNYIQICLKLTAPCETIAFKLISNQQTHEKQLYSGKVLKKKNQSHNSIQTGFKQLFHARQLRTDWFQTNSMAVTQVHSDWF